MLRYPVHCRAARCCSSAAGLPLPLLAANAAGLNSLMNSQVLPAACHPVLSQLLWYSNATL